MIAKVVTNGRVIVVSLARPANPVITHVHGGTATHGSLLHNNVLDNQLVLLQVLGLGVRLGVLQQVEDESNRLLGPTSYEQNETHNR